MRRRQSSYARGKLPAQARRVQGPPGGLPELS